MKEPKGRVNVDNFKAFLHEVRIMAYVGKHEHVVELYGAVVEHIITREVKAADQ